jgi:hypothetical protein
MIEDTDAAERALAASHSCPGEVLDPVKSVRPPADSFKNFSLRDLFASAQSFPFKDPGGQKSGRWIWESPALETPKHGNGSFSIKANRPFSFESSLAIMVPTMPAPMTMTS